MIPTPDNTICAFKLDELLEFLGQVALPPWRDVDGKLIGTEIPCAPIADSIIKWVRQHDLNPQFIVMRDDG
jgi:hypothetical protein